MVREWRVVTPHPDVLGQPVLKLLILGKLMETLVRVGTAEKGRARAIPPPLFMYQARNKGVIWLAV
jgi:hypothetical protein